MMLSDPSRRLTVLGDDERPLGTATVDLVSAALSRSGGRGGGRP
jgi:hypothetical protein